MKRHLLENHLLVKGLNPMDRHVALRAKRINNALKLLGLIELQAAKLETVESALDKLIREA